MTRNNTSTLEPFDPEIERTLRRLCNLVEKKVSPKKERPTMEETRVLGAANIAGAGNGAVVGAAGVENPRRTLMEYACHNGFPPRLGRLPKIKMESPPIFSVRV